MEHYPLYLYFRLPVIPPRSYYSSYYYLLPPTFPCLLSVPKAILQIDQSILESVLRSECTEKPTSHLYSHLTMVSILVIEGLRARWLQDIPDLDDDWDGIWDFPFKSLVSLRDRLIQFKLIHRTNFTPHRLHKMCSEYSSSECWRCGGTPGNFSHITRSLSNI